MDQDTDGYYGENEANVEDLDLSFLDDDESTTDDLAK